MNRISHTRPKGFTLVEVALAITIVAIVVLASIGLLMPSQRAIDDVLTGGQATRLRQEIEKEYSVLRPKTDTGFASAFDKAYDAVKNGATRTGILCAFFYRADPGSTLEDGRLTPFSGDVTKSQPGKDYVVQAAVMSLANFKKTPAYLEAIEGRLFMVRLLPIEGLVSENPVAPQPELPAPLKPLPPNGLRAFLQANPPEAYPLAVIPASAEFFEVIDIDTPDTTFEALPDPVTKQAANGKAPAKAIITLNMGFNR